MTNPIYDVAIVGGGLVGASLALALEGRGLNIAVLERHNFRQAAPPGFDDRTLALSLASQNIFDAMGLWQDLAAELTPIRRVHVSQRGLPGTVRINAGDYGLEALGHVVAARAIGQAVATRLPAARDIEMVVPATVTGISTSPDQVEIQYVTDGQARSLAARLLVGADGTASTVRKLLGIPAEEEDYEQTAIIANVTPQVAHDGQAFERLTDTGPLAMLPHGPRRCGSVWVAQRSQVEALLALSDDDYCQQLQQRFGYRLGTLQRVGVRSSYPLGRLYVPSPAGQRCLLVGNAAHTIHPIAAQGFNLGLRDVATLAELIAGAQSAGADCGASMLLDQYWHWRRPDVERTMAFTDGLMRVFAQPLPLIKAIRTAAMIGAQMLPQVRAAIAQRTMGFGGRVPAMARGDSL